MAVQIVYSTYNDCLNLNNSYSIVKSVFLINLLTLKSCFLQRCKQTVVPGFYGM